MDWETLKTAHQKSRRPIICKEALCAVLLRLQIIVHVRFTSVNAAKKSPIWPQTPPRLQFQGIVMPFLCKRGARDSCGALTVLDRKEKLPPHPSPPTTAFTKKHYSTQSTCKRGTENGPKRPKSLRVYKESPLRGPSSVNAASPGGRRATMGDDGTAMGSGSYG